MTLGKVLRIIKHGVARDLGREGAGNHESWGTKRLLQKMNQKKERTKKRRSNQRSCAKLQLLARRSMSKLLVLLAVQEYVPSHRCSTMLTRNQRQLRASGGVVRHLQYPVNGTTGYFSMNLCTSFLIEQSDGRVRRRDIALMTANILGFSVFEAYWERTRKILLRLTAQKRDPASGRRREHWVLTLVGSG